MSATSHAMQKALDLALQYTGTHHGSSRWTQFRECPRAHRLRYVDGLRLVEPPDYFAIGNVVHAGLCYAALGEIEGFRWKLSDVLSEAQKRKLWTADVFAEGKRLLKAYFGNWGVENASWGKTSELLEVEWFVRSDKLVLPYTSRIDLLLAAKPLNNNRDRLVIVDHKTRASMPGDTDDQLARKWATRPQFLGSAYCVREIEGELPVFCVNVITKTQIPKFRRVIWEYTDEELDCWAEAHNASLANGTDADWMNYQSCAPDLGSPCWAFSWCHGTDEEKQLYTLQPPKRKKKKKYGKDEGQKSSTA
jgi:hypothetical protein